MATLTAERTMLYCPKCQRKYDVGSQRFCNNDGGRLLPAVNTGVKRDNQSKGVFTNLLAKTSNRNEKDERLSKNPRFVKAENNEPKFETPAKSKVFKTEQTLNPKIGKPIKQQKSAARSNKTPLVESTTPTVNKDRGSTKPNNTGRENTSKPLSRLITTDTDINLGRAELGDRKTNPTGRLALTWENPAILHGQTVKGRYKITSSYDSDKTSLAYLAEDQIHLGKKVIIRVLMEHDASDEFQNKLLKEERVSLSHIIHPNIAKVVDSGELPEGKPFIVTEFVENESVSDYLLKTGVFNQMRTARIIRQSSMALSEVHQNGILHRNLQPQHLLLTVSEAGNETVKVADFCVGDGKITKDNFKYKAPEQINGQLPTFASDSYSLAVVAYEMLTNRLPFKGESERELFKSQKAGLTVGASDLNPDLNPLVDNILRKALSYNPYDRYPKARDFGEALFNALTTATPWDNEVTPKPKITEVSEVTDKKEKITLPNMPIGVSRDVKTDESLDISVEPNEVKPDIHIESSEPTVVIDEIDDLETIDDDNIESDTERSNIGKTTLWKKRSPEPTKEGGSLFTIFSLLGLLALIVGAFAIWNYFSGLEDPAPTVAQQAELPTVKEPTIKDVDNVNKEVAPKDKIDIPPPEREIIPPKNFKYFENSKQNLKGDLAKNFRGFSMYYPETWSKFDTDTNYVDVKLKADDEGFPKQQFIVTRYDSKGTFESDEKNFPALVAKSNKILVDNLPNFDVVSQGEITVNNGWKAYEVKFKGKTDFPKKEDNFEIWGRRIWMPAARPGVNNGFVITMLATSLSDKIESLDDVGKTGDLGDILYTFKPDRSY